MCSPNDTYTLQEGGSGKPGVEKPNPNQIADNAAAQAENPAPIPTPTDDVDADFDTELERARAGDRSGLDDALEI